MVQRILIIETHVAARVARSCKRLGLITIATAATSDTDQRNELWDEVLDLPPESPPSALIDAARGAGAEAIHAAGLHMEAQMHLARAAEEAGLVFVGASSEALATIGDRERWRTIAADIGIRSVPGMCLAGRDEIGRTSELAMRGIAFPVVLKPRHVGTLVPSVIVHDAGELTDALSEIFDACVAVRAHEEIMIEHYIERARQIEIWVALDHNDVPLPLGECECSLREGDQWFVGESPSPVINSMWDGEALREALTDASVRLICQIGIRGLTAASFLLDPEGRFWLSGLRSGLPLEHALLEMGTGLDLVELQLRIARRETLPEEVEPSGHAIQARVLATTEKVNGAVGGALVEEMRWPPIPQGKLRLETSVGIGASPVRDGALVARLTAYAPIRHRAVLMLDRILAEGHIAPLKTNIERIRSVLGHESFRAGQYDNGFLERFEQEAG